MLDIYIVYNDEYFKEQINNLNNLDDYFVHFINEKTRTGLKEGFKIKSHWGAKLTPFILVANNDKAIKAFYSESKTDIIQDLNNFLNESKGN